eukprot:1970407-Amphidinium_carterae.1
MKIPMCGQLQKLHIGHCWHWALRIFRRLLRGRGIKVTSLSKWDCVVDTAGLACVGRAEGARDCYFGKHACSRLAMRTTSQSRASCFS